MMEGISRRAIPGLVLFAAGCANLQPEDAAPPTALQIDPATALHFPGAKAIAAGIDRSGERALRDGDRVALGVEVVIGEEVQRHLLELIVHRHKLGEDVVRINFTVTGDTNIVLSRRYTRQIDLELILRTPDGVEQQRSRLSDVPEIVVDESFVPAIQHSTGEQPQLFGMAVWRLGQFAQMLSDDPILKSLLKQAATVPFDISLLWRRQLRFNAHFEQGRATQDEMGSHELPFDLFLNDSLIVRLVATVADPQGAAGAIGGIVGLRAQDARHPDRHVKVQMLGASRGPRSDWQHDGVLASYGYADEGIGLAFSPDGRCLAMPGSGDLVELHDLTGADPSLATMLACKGRSTDLAYLDNSTLLVATKHHVQVFDVTKLNAPRLLAIHEVSDQHLCALEVVDTDTVFVGGVGYAISRWRFGPDRSRAPAMELVQAVQRVSGQVTYEDGTPGLMTSFTFTPSTGWLFGVDANRVLARSHDAETEWRCTSDGTWSRRSLDRVDHPTSRLSRLPDASPMQQFECVAKGTSLVQSSAAGAHAYGAGPLSLTGDACTRFLDANAKFSNYCHGFSADGRYYAYVAPGYRLFVDVERFLAAGK